MKFSSLPAPQRTQLAALASSIGSDLNTKQLSMAAPMNGDAQKGAKHLLELRRLGLVYSTERQAGQQYAKWFITSVGMAVFEGRPDGDVVLVPAEQCDLHQTPKPEPTAKLYRVVAKDNGTLFDQIATADEQAALNLLSYTAEKNPGVAFALITSIAVAHLPKPAATITRV